MKLAGSRNLSREDNQKPIGKPVKTARVTEIVIRYTEFIAGPQYPVTTIINARKEQ
jgi:hypothetical protein